jgi:hypothetical protein
MESTNIFSDNGEVFIAELPTSVVQLYDSLRVSDFDTPEQELGVFYGWKTVFHDIRNEEDMEISLAFLKEVGFNSPEDFLMYHVYQMLDSRVHRCGLCANYAEEYDGLCCVYCNLVSPMSIMENCFDSRTSKKYPN